MCVTNYINLHDHGRIVGQKKSGKKSYIQSKNRRTPTTYLDAQVCSFIGATLPSIFLIRCSFTTKKMFIFQKDDRHYITLSTFGFFKGGILTVNLTNFKFEPVDANKKLTPESATKAVVS